MMTDIKPNGVHVESVPVTRPKGYSPESLANLERRVAAACADIDAGATWVADVSLSSKGRKGWLPRGIGWFFANGFDLVIGLLDTVASRDATIAEAREALAGSQRAFALGLAASQAKADAEIARLREALASLARFTTDDAIADMALAALKEPS